LPYRCSAGYKVILVRQVGRKNRQMTKIGKVRIVTASLVIVVVVSGVVGKFNYGGICSLDVGQILATCPLGFLERFLASRALLPQWWFSVVLVVLSVILLGRVFCAWICPASLPRGVFGSRGELESKRKVAPKRAIWASYSSYAVLGGTLVSSFLFGFPVFCFFCPIGLFFGLLFAMARLFSPDPLSLELLLFPVLLGLELWVLRKAWCRSICPLGALLSIVGSFNRFLLPTVRKDKCLTAKGVNCRVCERVCPEGIDPASIGKSLSPNSCTKCLECYEKCPARAIEIAIFR
jgi:ferredoxin-type protein NapH